MGEGMWLRSGGLGLGTRTRSSDVSCCGLGDLRFLDGRGEQTFTRVGALYITSKEAGEGMLLWVPTPVLYFDTSTGLLLPQQACCPLSTAISQGEGKGLDRS
jgi:hypothetical protein